MANKRIYRITVEGDYYSAAAGGGNVLRLYKLDFLLPSLDSMLSVIKSKLLLSKLRNTYSDARAYHTHTITAITLKDGQVDPSVKSLPITSLTLVQLDDFCILNHVPVDVYKSGSLAQARVDVGKVYGELRSRVAATQEERDRETQENDLRKLNDLPEKQHGVEVSKEPVEPSSAPTPPVEPPTPPVEPPTAPVAIPSEPGPEGEEELPDFLEDPDPADPNTKVSNTSEANG